MGGRYALMDDAALISQQRPEGKPMNQMPRAFTVLIVTLTLSGCIIIPEGRLADGTVAPSRRIEQYASEGRIATGKSQAEEVARLLVATSSSTNQLTPSIYENKAQKQLAVVYDESCRAYGVTLNQHLCYLPMPMFGAKFDSQVAAVFLSHDDKGTLTRWHSVSGPNLSGFEHREPATQPVK
jgi:hypothetical protein